MPKNNFESAYSYLFTDSIDGELASAMGCFHTTGSALTTTRTDLQRTSCIHLCWKFAQLAAKRSFKTFFSTKSWHFAPFLSRRLAISIGVMRYRYLYIMQTLTDSQRFDFYCVLHRDIYVFSNRFLMKCPWSIFSSKYT